MDDSIQISRQDLISLIISSISGLVVLVEGIGFIPVSEAESIVEALPPSMTMKV